MMGLARGGSREFWFMGGNPYVNLLYLPFTFLSISYVLDGIIAGRGFRPVVDAPLLAAYFIGHGVAAHFINEAYSNRVLDGRAGDMARIAVAGYGALAAAAALGMIAVAEAGWNPFLIAVGALEVALLVAYNHPASRPAHNDVTVAVAVGALPALAGYFASGGPPSATAALTALACALLVSLEITPSRFVKRWRRGPEPRAIVYADGSMDRIDLRDLVERPERVIKIMLALSYVMPVLLYAIARC